MSVLVADTIVRSVVVGTLLTGGLIGAFALVRVSAAFRAAAWAAVVVLAVVLAPPWSALSKSNPSPATFAAAGAHGGTIRTPRGVPAGAAAKDAPREPASAMTSRPVRVRQLTVAVTDALSAAAGWTWLTIAALLLVRLTVRYVRLERSIRAMPVPGEMLAARLAESAERAGAKRAPRFALGEDDATPGLAGFFPPTIIVPAALCATATWDEIDCVVGHEVAHLRRYDHVVDAIVRIAHALAFFNPALYLAYARLRLDRELACDDAVVRARCDALSYAQLLVRLSRASRSRIELALSAPAHELIRRVESIVAMRPKRDARSSPGLAACALFAVPVWLLASNVQIVRAAPPAAPARTADTRIAETRAAEQPPAEVDSRMDAGAALRLYGYVGSVSVRTVPGDRLHVTALVRSGPRAAIALQGTSSGNLDLCAQNTAVARCADWNAARADESQRVDWEIELPAGRAISIRTVAGPIRVRTDGPVHVSSVEGDIDASGRTVDAITERGSIVAAITENDLSYWMELEARHGTVTVAVPADLRARVVASSIHGTVRASFPIVLGKDNGFDWVIARKNLRNAAESQKLVVVAGGDITLRT